MKERKLRKLGIGISWAMAALYGNTGGGLWWQSTSMAKYLYNFCQTIAFPSRQRWILWCTIQRLDFLRRQPFDPLLISTDSMLATILLTWTLATTPKMNKIRQRICFFFVTLNFLLKTPNVRSAPVYCLNTIRV